MKAFTRTTLTASLLFGTTLSASDLHLNSQAETTRNQTEATLVSSVHLNQSLLEAAAKSGC